MNVIRQLLSNSFFYHSISISCIMTLTLEFHTITFVVSEKAEQNNMKF